jgi:hypothetical protein
MSNWQKQDPRFVASVVIDSEERWTGLFGTYKMRDGSRANIARTIEQSGVELVVGHRSVSTARLLEMDRFVESNAHALGICHGGWNDFYRRNMRSMEEAIAFTGIQL